MPDAFAQHPSVRKRIDRGLRSKRRTRRSRLSCTTCAEVPRALADTNDSGNDDFALKRRPIALDTHKPSAEIEHDVVPLVSSRPKNRNPELGCLVDDRGFGDRAPLVRREHDHILVALPDNYLSVNSQLLSTPSSNSQFARSAASAAETSLSSPSGRAASSASRASAACSMSRFAWRAKYSVAGPSAKP